MSKRKLVFWLLYILLLCITALSHSEKSTYPVLSVFRETAETVVFNESQQTPQVFLLPLIISTNAQLLLTTLSQSQPSRYTTESSINRISPYSSLADVEGSRTQISTLTSTEAKISIFSFDSPLPTPKPASSVTTPLQGSSSSYDLFREVSSKDVTPTLSSMFYSSSSSAVEESHSNDGNTVTESGGTTSKGAVRVPTPSVLSTSKSVISTPVTMETVPQMPPTTLSIEDEGTKEFDKTTMTSIVTSRPGVPMPIYIGIVIVGGLVLIAAALLTFVLLYCFCGRKNYEYNTGNEYRVTVQKWNTYSAHYTANQADSAPSSRGSSISSLRSSNNKMKPRYGGVASSVDHVHTGAHYEMYSTPL